MLYNFFLLIVPCPESTNDCPLLNCVIRHGCYLHPVPMTRMSYYSKQFRSVTRLPYFVFSSWTTCFMAEAPSRRLGPGGRRAKGGLAVLTNESGKRRGRLTRDWTRSRHWESATHIRAPLCDARTPILFLTHAAAARGLCLPKEGPKDTFTGKQRFSTQRTEVSVLKLYININNNNATVKRRILKMWIRIRKKWK